MSFRQIRILCFSALVLFIPIDKNFRAQDVVKENNLKAVMIYNFTKFMRWPQEDSISTFKIFVMKGSNIVQPLRNIAEKRDFRGKKIVVREIENLNNIKDCGVLVLSDSSNNMLKTILSKAVESNILIVGSQEGLAEEGATVNFVKRDDTIRFEINVSTLKKTNIETNTQLLNLAVKLYN
jgi:hypothetical protein